MRKTRTSDFVASQAGRVWNRNSSVGWQKRVLLEQLRNGEGPAIGLRADYGCSAFTGKKYI